MKLTSAAVLLSSLAVSAAAAAATSGRARMFYHSSSYTANPIACAAANANLTIWRDEPVRARITDLAERQAGQLGRDAGHADIRNARQLGTITAFEVGDREGDCLSDLGPMLKAGFFEQSVLLRPLGNTVYVMPSYCIDEIDLGAVYDAILDVSTGASAGGQIA